MNIDLGDLASILSLPMSCMATWLAWRSHRAGSDAQARLLVIEQARSERETEKHLVEMQAIREAERVAEAKRLQAAAGRMQIEALRQMARLSPQLSREPTGRLVLSVYNAGGGLARDVSLLLDGIPLAQHPLSRDPSATLGPIPGGQTVHIRLAHVDGAPDEMHVRLRWADDSPMGRGESEATLRAE